MKIEEQVTNLELSKKLKELGVEQRPSKGEVYFTWGWGGLKPEYRVNVWYAETDENWFILYGGEESSHDWYRAFTVAELGEMLPVNTVKNYWIKEAVDGSRYYELVTDYEKFTDENEANARAECLIYLIENKLIDLRGTTPSK